MFRALAVDVTTEADPIGPRPEIKSMRVTGEIPIRRREEIDLVAFGTEREVSRAEIEFVRLVKHEEAARRNRRADRDEILLRTVRIVREIPAADVGDGAAGVEKFDRIDARQ